MSYYTSEQVEALLFAQREESRQEMNEYLCNHELPPVRLERAVTLPPASLSFSELFVMDKEKNMIKVI